ncbi:MAG: PRC-barrel domain-containing protein [Marvinbryantia sp.]|uniref:PRC-barrel domain-containing protein n=1 Tax=Marvinbryantia sp. TaxID=2496532 RepID=UPI0025EA35D4|nr:YlmC/YmxH family sporulation protein [uncultured Marvinbryantia sp.]
MRVCELRQKEVINVCTCASLGCVIDVEFDPKDGCITALIVPGGSRLSCFWGHDAEIIIPWRCICQIGKDIILVELPKEKNKDK